MVSGTTSTFKLQKDENGAISSNLIQEALDKFGLALLPDFVERKVLKGTLKEVKEMLETYPKTPYPFGKSVRLRQKDVDLKTHPNIKELFFKTQLKDLAKTYFQGEEFNFNQEIFITNEYSTKEGLARNGYLHFDRLPTFKLFYYLYDTTVSQGAFTCIPKSHKMGRLLREKAWEESNNYEEVKNRIFIDYPELGYEEKDCVPIEAPEGSLIIFNTDLFHKGGEVQEGKERLIIRAHSQLI
jgi:hypothetical protein